MEIKKAEEIGFCSGVRRAIKLLEEFALKRGGEETLGAVVHNQQVVDSLSSLGIKVVENLDQLRGNVVAIPAHGASPQVIEELQARGLEIIDTTCPIVRKTQMTAKELASSGFEIVIFGDAEHPEVKGILSWAGGRGIATLDAETVSKFSKPPRRLGVLSQTTQSPAQFVHFVNSLVTSSLPRSAELRIINTICHTTRRRQEAALKLARKVNLMIVIGGRDSANTRHLAEICSSTGAETHHVETAKEIEAGWLKGKHWIGVTAGTSTPDQIIEEVMLKLEGIKGLVNAA